MEAANATSEKARRVRDLCERFLTGDIARIQREHQNVYEKGHGNEKNRKSSMCWKLSAFSQK